MASPEEEVLESMRVVEEEIDARIDLLESQNAKYESVLRYIRYINNRREEEMKEEEIKEREKSSSSSSSSDYKVAERKDTQASKQAVGMTQLNQVPMASQSREGSSSSSSSNSNLARRIEKRQQEEQRKKGDTRSLQDSKSILSSSLQSLSEEEEVTFFIDFIRSFIACSLND